MDDATLALLVDLHKRQPRQGPGGKAETLRAVDLAGLAADAPLRIADIGCGTGAQTLDLAQALNAEIVAVDFLPEFLAVLEERARATGVADRIETLAASMDELPFAEAEFHVVWSEGAVYNMGFEAGVTAWRRFLKPGGVLAVSEITWTTGARPAEIEDYWTGQYPEIATAAEKIAVLEKSGYAPIGHFLLPENCWLENYYAPLRDQYPAFLARHPGDPAAEAIVAADRAEIALYETYKDYYSYGVYVARKRG
jgi:SAM-dependent methyltransferase